MLYNISRIFKGTKYFILFNVPIILKHLFDIKTQVGCITNVDYDSLYACTYVASVRDISTIVCYDQVLFVEVTKLLRFLEEKKLQLLFLLLQVFTKFHV